MDLEPCVDGDEIFECCFVLESVFGAAETGDQHAFELVGGDQGRQAFGFELQADGR